LFQEMFYGGGEKNLKDWVGRRGRGGGIREKKVVFFTLGQKERKGKYVKGGVSEIEEGRANETKKGLAVKKCEKKKSAGRSICTKGGKRVGRAGRN